MQGALHIAACCLTVAVAAAAGPAVAAERASPRQLMQEGRTALQAGDPYLALRKVALARELEPANPDIRRALADVLMQLGAPQGAARALGTQDDLGIRIGQATEAVRWGEQVDGPDPAYPFAGTDAAIAKLDELIADVSSMPTPDAGALRRLQCDRVVALRNRERWAEALSLADELEQAGPLPSYVRQAQADALLATEQPERALAAYGDVLAADPRNRDARAGLFYAQVESEDFDAAFATVDALAAEGAPMRRVGVSRGESSDPDWLDAQLLRAQARRYADMLADAWQLLDPLVASAPAAPYLRMERSELAGARGWPRLAHEEARIAHSLAPDAPGARQVLADAEMRRRQWNAAERHAREAAALRPDNPQVHRLLADIEAHRDAQLLLAIAPRRADGGGRNAPGDGISASARVYTPPLAERWRLLAAAERELDEPEGEHLSRNRYGAGIEGRWPDVTFELVGWANRGLLDHGGADASVQWQPDDHWTLIGELQAFSANTPLRAIEAGVRADAASLGVVHAWNEKRVASASLTTLDFTDGNRRWQLSADYTGTIVDRPTLDVLLRPALYASRNSLRDAPYFNPERDASISLGVDVRHLIWRRYQRSLRQRLLATLGGYWQSGFDSDVIGGVEYSQTYSHDPRSEWNYGVAWTRATYDGDSERSLVAFVRLDQRF
ncbi:poly-beta-1,6 N-acetyl-D-glucosamine export porin PgaA [Lysobacter panacisoli]|nr:poly-beta-1,6 N-acetyl-D-glucosamine export porin PgaA [Lysobacter panacisoli]